MVNDTGILRGEGNAPEIDWKVATPAVLQQDSNTNALACPTGLKSPIDDKEETSGLSNLSGAPGPTRSATVAFIAGAG